MEKKPDFGVEFVPYKKIKGLVEKTRLAEEKGFNYVWITDHYNNRNVYVTLAAIAMETEKINLGVGVTNPYVVSPVWTATAIASVDEVSNGRAILGMGAGDKATLESLGLKMEKPLSAVREAVTIIRSLWEGKTVKFEGKKFRVAGARLNFKVKRKIPIYVGAQGVKMLQTAGEIGDGVLINASHPKDIEFAVENIEKGVSKANKKMEDVSVAAYTSFSISQDKGEAESKAREVVSFIVAGSPPPVLERHGIPVEEAEKIKDLLAKGKFGKAFSAVTAEMLDAFSISGTPEECLTKVEEILRKGIDQLVVGSPIGPDVKKSIELVSEKIISAFS